MRIVDIKGGFGNQLFQYAFALNLQRQGHRVYAYFSKGYKDNEKTNSYSEKREIIIKSKDFGIKKLNKTFYYLLELFKKIPLINNKFYEIIFEEEYNVNYKFKAVTSLNGFWQDLTIVENILDELKQVFLTKKILSKDKKNRTLVQVRRVTSHSDIRYHLRRHTASIHTISVLIWTMTYCIMRSLRLGTAISRKYSISFIIN